MPEGRGGSPRCIRGTRAGPHQPRSTVLTEADEATVVEFRRRALLPFDAVLGCLRGAIPRLTRSAGAPAAAAQQQQPAPAALALRAV